MPAQPPDVEQPTAIPAVGRVGLFALGVALIVVAIAVSSVSDSRTTLVVIGAVLAVIGALGSVAPLQDSLSVRMPSEQLRAVAEQDALIEELGQLRDVEGVPDYARRRDINARQMRVYQDLTTGQAKSSYRRSQVAFLTGLMLIAGAVVFAFVAHNTATKITAASIAAIGSTLSAYISRTYIRAYERTLDQLNFYYREPLVNSYLLTAELLVADIPADRRAGLYDDLVREVLRAARIAQSQADLRTGDSAGEARAEVYADLVRDALGAVRPEQTGR